MSQSRVASSAGDLAIPADQRHRQQAGSYKVYVQI
jgi:hypothetical protein